MIPPALLADIPEVNPGLGLFMQAFWDLAADRGQGNKIPWSVIQHWGEAHRLDYETIDDLHFYVNRLDITYINWSKKKQQEEERNRKIREGRNGNTS